MTIQEARQTMVKAFEADPDFRQGYVSNVAMLLHDQFGITDFETRNKAGEAIITLVFEG